MRFDFEGAGPAPDNFTKERILRSIGEAFSIQVRKCDTLGRFDHQIFALLMPQTSAAEAQLFCDRLKQLLAEISKQIEYVQVKLRVGLTDFVSGTDESASDMLARAMNLLHHAKDA
jgi:PleD family two-component response regulator